VITEGEGVYTVHGLSVQTPVQREVATRGDLEDLIAAGHAARVGGALCPQAMTTEWVALWLGTAYSDAAAALRVDLPPLPSGRISATGGSFFLGPPAKLYVYLEHMVRALRREFETAASGERRRDLASLMRWTLPTHPLAVETALELSPQPLYPGAMIQTAPTLGVRPTTDTVLTSGGLRDVHVLAFVGGTCSRRSEFAEQFSTLLNDRGVQVSIGSFAETLRRIRSSDQETPEKQHMMRWGQEEVEVSPLYYSIATLVGALRSHPSTTRIILDGIRHKTILQVIRWLQPQRLSTIAVTCPPGEFAARLRDRHPQANPDFILNDPTECEIHELVDSAEYRIEDSSSATKRQEFLHGLAATVV
jgi:hypothetical protein